MCVVLVIIINTIGIRITMLIRIKPECVELVMEKTAVGDWFLLYLLGQNIDHIVFKVREDIYRKHCQRHNGPRNLLRDLN